jgi:hypothetical protein
VIPAPLTTVSSLDGLRWEFAVDPAGTTIVLRVEPKASGPRKGRLRIGEITAMTFTQFVFP